MAGRWRNGLLVAFALQVLVIGLGLTGLSIASTDGDKHHELREGDAVPLLVNKIGPFSNPSETYQYYDLPFCRPDEIIGKRRTLGEFLSGDRPTNSLYELKFRVDKDMESVCSNTLDKEEVSKFRDAVRDNFYFQMHYDDLPFWGFVGMSREMRQGPKEKQPHYLLYTHFNFTILHSENQIIDISALGDPDSAVDISDDVGICIKFTYSVLWNATSVLFAERMNKHTGVSTVPYHLKTYWFSVINSIVIVVMLAGAPIHMRRIRLYVEMKREKVGWKQLHADVFRYPPHTSFFCAVLGSGTQLLTLVILLFVLACMGVINPYNLGKFYSYLLVLYPLTAVLAGFTSASFRSEFAGTGRDVVKCVCLTGVLYLGPLFTTFFFLSTVATSYGTTYAITFGTTVTAFCIWSVFSIPFISLGGMVARTYSSEFRRPCWTRRSPREIPPLPWYRKMPAKMVPCSLLPFFAIFVQMHFFSASMWHDKVLPVFSILFLMVFILILITAIWTIVLTHYQLSEENYKWWWSSLLCGGSTAVFLYAYCCLFYARSNMSGLLQLAFFLGYNAYLCYAIFLMLGTIGFCSSLFFVCYTYSPAQLD